MGSTAWCKVVDLGTRAVGKVVRERILARYLADRRSELIVGTPLDEDHPGDITTALVDGEHGGRDSNSVTSGSMAGDIGATSTGIECYRWSSS